MRKHYVLGFIVLGFVCFGMQAKPVHAAISVIAYTPVASSTDTTNATTTAINTTGASLLIVGVCGSSPQPPTITDSQNNTWYAAPTFPQSVGQLAGIYYAYNPSTSPSQTFHVVQAGLYPSIQAIALSGTVTTSAVFDVGSGTSTQANASSVKPGSITPAQAGEFFYTNGCFGSASVTTSSIDSGFTDMGIALENGNSVGQSDGYLLDSGSSAENPTWTFNSGNNWLYTGMAAFKPAVVISNPPPTEYWFSGIIHLIGTFIFH